MKHQPTAEQKAKAEERRAQLKELAARVSAMTDEQKAALLDKVGTVLTCEGHPLSLHNTMMLAYQADRVSMVGGYRQWQAVGRQVRKGEKSLGIWIPGGSKEEKEENERPAFFIFGSVFDVSQTDPISEEPTRNSAGALITPEFREEWNKTQEFIQA